MKKQSNEEAHFRESNVPNKEYGDEKVYDVLIVGGGMCDCKHL